MEEKNLPDRCPNCITLLPEGSKFCPNCGQKRFGHHARSIRHLLVESVGDFFHFDSKFTGTLVPLLIKPGFLTNEFLEGRRVRYFEPFKLLLFISFLYFFISGMMPHSEKKGDDIVIREKKEEKAFHIDKDTTLNKGHLSINTSHELERILLWPDDTLKNLVKKEGGLDIFVENHGKHSTWVEKFFTKGAIKDRLTGSGTLSENLHKTIPKLIFILIPVFALFMKLLYIRNKIPYFNHVIFSIHFLSFFFLIMIFNDLAGLVLPWMTTITTLFFFVYLFLALRKVYKQKKGKTLLKFSAFLFGSIFIVLMFFIMATVISFVMI